MAFTLPDLPYEKSALEPYISAETLEYHHGKHHNAYVTNLNNLLKDKDLGYESQADLEGIILSSEGGLFNNSAQVWNHSFYWKCMKPGGGGAPAGALADAITAAFGSYDEFVKQFSDAAMTQFGSGWAWLVLENGELAAPGATGNRRRLRVGRAGEEPPGLCQRGRLRFGRVDHYPLAIDLEHRRARHLLQ